MANYRATLARHQRHTRDLIGMLGPIGSRLQCGVFSGRVDLQS